MPVIKPATILFAVTATVQPIPPWSPTSGKAAVKDEYRICKNYWTERQPTDIDLLAFCGPRLYPKRRVR
jgi:hypothetical protein